MAKLRVHCFSLSLDGYGAGPDQSLENPLGVGGEKLHAWMFGSDKGSTGIDDDFAKRGFEGIGAWILGRNMFGPVRGPWPDESWKGWWGDSPPYHTPVFVLTHHARAPLTMEGGTTFHFVTDGIQSALQQAKSAGCKDVRVGGGAATIRQYLQAGLVDEMHVAISPVALGRGEPLYKDIDLPALGYATTEHVPSAAATHVVLTKR